MVVDTEKNPVLSDTLTLCDTFSLRDFRISLFHVLPKISRITKQT